MTLRPSPSLTDQAPLFLSLIAGSLAQGAITLPPTETSASVTAPRGLPLCAVRALIAGCFLRCFPNPQCRCDEMLQSRSIFPDAVSSWNELERDYAGLLASRALRIHK